MRVNEKIDGVLEALESYQLNDSEYMNELIRFMKDLKDGVIVILTQTEKDVLLKMINKTLQTPMVHKTWVFNGCNIIREIKRKVEVKR